MKYLAVFLKLWSDTRSSLAAFPPRLACRWRASRRGTEAVPRLRVEVTVVLWSKTRRPPPSSDPLIRSGLRRKVLRGRVCIPFWWAITGKGAERELSRQNYGFHLARRGTPRGAARSPPPEWECSGRRRPDSGRIQRDQRTKRQFHCCQAGLEGVKQQKEPNRTWPTGNVLKGVFESGCWKYRAGLWPGRTIGYKEEALLYYHLCKYVFM